MLKALETQLEINLSALAHNYHFITSQLKPTTKMMAVVKAFGYGSDPIAVAKELEILGVAYFAVAYTNEGVALRDAGITKPILVLHPQPTNFDVIIERCLEPSIYSLKMLTDFLSFAKLKRQSDYPVHIKINTGLNRLGFAENEITNALDIIKAQHTIKVRSVFSHLAASEDINEKEFTQLQLSSFKTISEIIISALPYTPFRHTLNTSGILNYPEAQYDIVRAGIGLYGFGNTIEINKKLQPIATLKTVISQIHELKAGDTLGYNRAFKVTSSTTTATLPIGHADGISRSYGNGVGWVTVNDQKAFIQGNVCMDMIMIDITGINCKEGDEVIVFGNQVNAEILSNSVSSISYELLTAISQRIKRVVYRN